MDANSKFYEIYANLPLNARKEIIVVVNEEPLTWNAARVEIDDHTKKGKEILDKLVQMEILKNNE